MDSIPHTLLEPSGPPGVPKASTGHKNYTRAIINGNHAVEPGYLNDPNKFTNLRSAVAAFARRQ